MNRVFVEWEIQATYEPPQKAFLKIKGDTVYGNLINLTVLDTSGKSGSATSSLQKTHPTLVNQLRGETPPLQSAHSAGRPSREGHGHGRGGGEPGVGPKALSPVHGTQRCPALWAASTEVQKAKYKGVESGKMWNLRGEAKQEARVSARLSHRINWGGSSGASTTMSAFARGTFWGALRMCPQASGMLGPVPGTGKGMLKKTTSSLSSQMRSPYVGAIDINHESNYNALTPCTLRKRIMLEVTFGLKTERCEGCQEQRSCISGWRKELNVQENIIRT